MKLLSRRIFRYEMWAYAQITDLEFKTNLTNDTSIINEVIKGKWFIWFIWQGEKYPNGIIWNITNEENDKIAEIKNVRLHGFYGAGSLKKDDFKDISNENLLPELIEYIKANLDKSEQSNNYLDKVNNYVIEKIISRTKYYQLTNIDTIKESNINVFSLFISFLLLNFDKRSVTLIEFGQD